jgi:hypothetical protein
MDRMQSFARVLVGAIAIYFSVNVLVMMIAPVGMMLNRPNVESVGLMALSLLIFAACLVLLQYFGVFRPQKVVNLITSQVEPPQAIEENQWLPAAYRLVCMFTGLYCVYGFVLRVTRVLTLYVLYQNIAARSAPSPIRPEEIVTTLILLGLGLYLLAGAPHFVRWHLRKTARFCAENAVK